MLAFGALATAIVLGLLASVSALPVLLLGDPLSVEEAERAIALHLAANAATSNLAPPQVEVLEVGKSMLGLGSFSGGHVAMAQLPAREGEPPRTAYFCLKAHYLLGECRSWRWRLAL